jgi:hypothetical protein
MVGRDTVTDVCRDKGRLSGEPSFVFLGAMRVRQSATAVCAANRKSDVMTRASQWPRHRHTHPSMSAKGAMATLRLYDGIFANDEAAGLPSGLLVR